MTLAIASVVKSQIPPEPTANQKSPIKILFPKNKTYVTQKTIKVTGIVSDVSIQQVNIRVVGGEPVGGSAVPITKGACEVTVQLQAGLNEISVFPAGKEGTGAKITIFLKTGANANCS